MAQRREIPGIATAIPCNEGGLMAAATSKAAPTIANMRGKTTASTGADKATQPTMSSTGTQQESRHSDRAAGRAAAS